MSPFDLCLVWSWEYDRDFARMLEEACTQRGLTLLQITPWNLDDALRGLDEGRLGFTALLDRASDEDDRFIPVVQWARRYRALRINAYEQARRSWDKAEMHLALSGRIVTPFTVILPPYSESPETPALDPADLAALGGCFTVKPAHGAGGVGVVDHCTLDGVAAARREFPDDKYLLQARVVPVRLDDRPAWFRVIYAAGRVFPCWWHNESHVYAPVTEEQSERLGLGGLAHLADVIANTSRLQLFSSEIARTADGCLVVIDYANDVIDLRLQSQAYEGVPDGIVWEIAVSLAGLVESYQNRPACTAEECKTSP